MIKYFCLLLFLCSSLFSSCACQKQLSGAAKPIEQVKRAADGQDVDQNELTKAISQLAEERNKQASDSLIKLMLTTDNLELANTCLIALGDIGEPKSMAAIISFSERKPPVIRRQAIISARKIGGKEAAEWLLVMAYGYEDAQVRKEALSALQEVEARLDQGKGN